MLILPLFLFIFGACVGSFLNVLVDRLPRNEPVFKSRSHCEYCNRILKWHDLIPIASFGINSGKCRYCSARLSFYYPVIELITGILFVTIGNYELETVNYAGNYLVLLFYFFVISAFVILFFTDLRYGVLPDKVIYPAIVITLFFLIINSQFVLFNSLLSGVFASAFFLLIYLLTRGKGMGEGDIKLVFLLGLFLGFPKIIVCLYIAFLTGAILSVILIIWRQKKIIGSTIAFGPFLIFGAFLSFFLGEKILREFTLYFLH